MLPDVSQFSNAVQSALRLSSHLKGKAWSVRREAWTALNAEFLYEQYSDENERNRVMRYHLAKRWPTATKQERMHFARWIVRDWGGIKRNSPDTIKRHLALAEQTEPLTPFSGVASYSKILSIKDPTAYAIFDARVAYSLNAIQLAQSAKEANPAGFLVFPCPPGQNREISGEGKKPGYMDILGRPALLSRGFIFIDKKDAYEVYLKLLRLVCEKSQQSMLDVEMELFGKVFHFCEMARTALSDCHV